MSGARNAWVALGALVAGCTAASEHAPPTRALSFTPQVAIDEEYSCFGFSTEETPALRIQGIALEAAEDGGVALHHVALYAVPGGYPAGPVGCELMPEGALELDVWAPGGLPLELPEDVGLAVPDGATLVVQAHALRTSSMPAAASTLWLLLATSEPAHLAGWMSARAPVPAIRPHHTEVSTALCRPEGELHVLSTWPHMHTTGAEFHGTVVRADGTREALVDVAPWSFTDQRAYPLDVTLAEGDVVETRCEWRNETDDYVLPGPRTIDEMCGQSLVAWPAENARCAP